ncbi:MAG: methionine--tRNA ligase [Aestuariivirga sp.]|uniref:methionine--tRNA ligase n=1 Tax=Aestuariivirga sp. TaxID=2650926 RepID=UPI0025C54E61|nr:methionine--tRNA ligase [Aestuariivirga sp.]MCA3562366.1 methionine--tRNA ligase [Aestuariivirga sp.]
MQSYLTTPIYYVNGPPHLGHAFTTVVADILKRQNARLGVATLLSTGCDEHGQKNAQAASAMGLDPQRYLDLRSAEFRALFDRLNVGYDVFARTSSAVHVPQVQHIVGRLHERGLLHRKTYEGHYCAGCEQFKKTSDLDQAGHCREHPNLVAGLIREENYFLAIEPFRQAIRAHIAARPDFIRPLTFRMELLRLLAEPLEDLCISRPAARVPLGVRFPFDPDYVVYVWFDALINYLTNLGWPAPGYRAWWAGAEHIIGKDILKTHGVYWPAMLLALGEPLPKRLLVHSHWVGEGGLKMSKSLGNVVDPNAVIDELGADALRYVFARHMRADADSAISVALIRQCYVAELANKLGNLHARLLSFTHAAFAGRVPPKGALSPVDEAVRSCVLAAAQRFAASLSPEDIPASTRAVLDAVEQLNRYVTSEAPWSLAKSRLTRSRGETVTHVALDGLRLVFEALWPIMPATAQRALAPLPRRAGPSEVWQPQLDLLEDGASLGEASILFPRMGRTL